MASLPSGFVSEFLSVARGQVGVREVGTNGGEAIRAFQSATWLEPGPWPWCAAFVCWCFLAACNRFPSLASIRPTTPRAREFIQWGRTRGFQVISGGSVALGWKPGDIVVFRFSTGHHCGIVDSIDSRRGFWSIEGNTNSAGSREGDGVWHRERSISNVSAFVRLNP